MRYRDGFRTDAWEIVAGRHRVEAVRSLGWTEIRKKEEVSAQVEPKPRGGRPAGGINAAVRELGIDRTEAQRAGGTFNRSRRTESPGTSATKPPRRPGCPAGPTHTRSAISSSAYTP
jgi:hypothetical protein